jgi:hypothetical protein
MKDKKTPKGVLIFKINPELKARFNEACQARGLDIMNTQKELMEYAMQKFLETNIEKQDVKKLMEATDEKN